MIETKSIMVKIMLLLKTDLEHPSKEVYIKIYEFINDIYDDDNQYTTYDKQIIEYIISIILTKSNINNYEKKILIFIISKIEDKKNFNNGGFYKSTLLKIIHDICLFHNNKKNIEIKEKFKEIMIKMLKIKNSEIEKETLKYKNL